MANPDAFAEPLVSYEGLLTKGYRETDVSKEAEVKRHFALPSVVRLLEAVRKMRYDSGRQQDYSRDLLLSFLLIGLILGLSIRGARDFVQGSQAMRNLLGLPPLSDDIREKLQIRRFKRERKRTPMNLLSHPDNEEQDDDDDDIREDGFPTRQEINRFVKWLFEYGKNTGDDDPHQTLEFLRNEAYVNSVVDLYEQFPQDVRFRRFAIDGKETASANRFGDRDRLDDGAANLYGLYGRWKMTIVTELSIAIAGVVSNDADTVSPLATDLLLPQLKENRDRIETEAERRGLDLHDFLEGAALAGDSAFYNRYVTAAAKEIGLNPLLRTENMLSRDVTGYRAVGPKGAKILLAQTNDGCFVCPCSEDQKPHERLIMRQLSQSKRGVYVRCERGQHCPHTHGVPYHVTLGGPTHDRQKRLIPKKERSCAGVGLIWKGDARAVALIHKLENAIEHYHSTQREQAKMGDKEHPNERRRIWGDFANRFWWYLADLVHNNRIHLGLQELRRRGWKLRELSWHQQFYATVANWRQIHLIALGEPGNTPRGRRRRRQRGDPLYHAYFLPKPKGDVWLIDYDCD